MADFRSFKVLSLVKVFCLDTFDTIQPKFILSTALIIPCWNVCYLRYVKILFLCAFTLDNCLFALNFLLQLIYFPSLLCIFQSLIIKLILDDVVVLIREVIVIKLDCLVLMIIIDCLPIIQQLFQSLFKRLLPFNKLCDLYLCPLKTPHLLFQRFFQRKMLQAILCIFFNALLLFEGKYHKCFEHILRCYRFLHRSIQTLLLYYLIQSDGRRGNNIIMLDPERRQSGFYSKANLQLRQIEYNCRQVVSMTKYLNTLSSEIASSEVNCRKIEIFKSEIKDKLKEFALTIDEIYKILDRKIILMLAELKKMQNKEEKLASNVCGKCNNRLAPKNHEENQRMGNSESERIFSDTLNPRVTHLEAKINEYQANQMKLKSKITELKTKNETLLEEFNRLSAASNRKINELSNKISKDSFSSQHQIFDQSPKKLQNNQILSPSPAKPKKTNQWNFETEQFSYQLSNEAGSYTSDHHQEKSKLLNFGCMPARAPKANPNPLLISNASESYEKLDRDDKNRRFDLLLNKLRNSQQQSTDESHSEELRAQEEPGSVFSQNIVQRYQV